MALRQIFYSEEILCDLIKKFKRWFDPKRNLFNPTMPPKTWLDVVYIPLYFITFGAVVVPIAALESIKLGK